MAPPAEFSYGPTGADPDSRFLARGDHGVQFPQAALDQWRAVLPGLPWISVHGEWGLSRGACCRLVAVAAWSQKAAPIRVSFLKKTWRLQFIAVVLTALGELPLDWSPTVFSRLAERVRSHLLHADWAVLDKFKFAEAALCDVQAEPEAAGSGATTATPQGELAAAHVRWCDLQSASGFYDDVGYLEDKLDPRMTALGRGVVFTLATGCVTRVPCPHSATWKRCLASVIALEAIASGDSAEDAAEAISDYLRVTAPEYELMILCAAGRDSAAELRMRLAYGSTDKSKTAAVIKYLDNVAAHLPAFALVFSTGEERSFPLGGAGTASAAMVAHADAYDLPPRDGCTLDLLRSLEEVWSPCTAMLEAADFRSQLTVPERLSRMRAKAVADRATAAAAGAVGHLGTLSIGGGDKTKGGRFGVPIQYDGNRRKEMEAPHFLALVADLRAIHDAGGSNRGKDIVEMALLGGTSLHTSSFVYQMAVGTFDSDGVAPEIYFLTGDCASELSAAVGRAVARTLSRSHKEVPPSMLAYSDPDLTHQMLSADWSTVNWGQALARAQAFRLAHADEDPCPVVVSLAGQYSSKVQVEALYEVAEAVLPLFRYSGRPNAEQDLGGSVSGSSSSAASRATTVRVAPEIPHAANDYYYMDGLLDAAERYREHGGTPERDAVLAVGIVAFLHGITRVMGARAHRASHSKNPQVEAPDMIVDQHALFQFRRDEADLKQVSGQRRAGAWARVLDRADTGGEAKPVVSPHLPPAVIAATKLPLSAGEKRAREALQSGALEREVVDTTLVTKRAGVFRCAYWGMPAWHVDNGHGVHMFYSVTAEEAWLLEKGFDLAKLCRHVLIGSGAVPWRDACKKDRSTEGHTSAFDTCHVVMAGYKPALFRISSVDGHVGSRPGDEGGPGGRGRGRGGGRGGRGDDASGGAGRGKGAGRGRGAPPGEGGERAPGPVVLQRGAGRGRGAPPPPSEEAGAFVDSSSDTAPTPPFAGLGGSCGCGRGAIPGHAQFGSPVAPLPPVDRCAAVDETFDDPAALPPGLHAGAPFSQDRIRYARCAPSHDDSGDARVVSSVDFHDDDGPAQVLPVRSLSDHVCEWVRAECGHCPRTWWVCAPGRNPGNGCGAEWGCGIDHECTGSAGYRVDGSSLTLTGDSPLPVRGPDLVMPCSPRVRCLLRGGAGAYHCGRPLPRLFPRGVFGAAGRYPLVPCGGGMVSPLGFGSAVPVRGMAGVSPCPPRHL